MRGVAATGQYHLRERVAQINTTLRKLVAQVSTTCVSGWCGAHTQMAQIPMPTPDHPLTQVVLT